MTERAPTGNGWSSLTLPRETVAVLLESTTGLPVLTAHVVVADACFFDGHALWVLDQLRARLAEHVPGQHRALHRPAREGRTRRP